MNTNLKRRFLGYYPTPTEVFMEYIFPEIKAHLYDYLWVDMFSGEGNLILPMLEAIPEERRIEFFEKHIFLFDIQENMVKKAIEKAMEYGIPKEVAERNIQVRDTIENYPEFLLRMDYPVFHITNPPYLYLGYIMKHEETRKYLKYFKGEKEGYQDLYQLALINDLRHGIRKMIYIIPSNFLFGASVSNKIRKDFLAYYTIKKAIIFERPIFDFTGTNVVICFFERKNVYGHERIVFEGLKINHDKKKRIYVLDPKNNYRAGLEFEEFVKSAKADKPLEVQFYLLLDDVKKNEGQIEVEVIDVNDFEGGKYKKKKIYVNEKLAQKIRSNILFIKTLDTGTAKGRAGLYRIRDFFEADGILVSKEKYRTHPIQVFLHPTLSIEDQILLRDYFNLVLEYFREITDSEFMTTYKYSDSEYTRKYLGLSQAKALIQTFPILEMNDEEKLTLKDLISKKDGEGLVSYIKNRKRKKVLWV